MPSAYDVESVCRSVDATNPYETVTHLCGTSYDGSIWRIPIDDAIEGIKCGRFAFYILQAEGKKLPLRIARSPYNRLYLKPEQDKREPFTLLKLPTVTTGG
jgi:hypothetical protein